MAITNEGRITVLSEEAIAEGAVVKAGTGAENFGAVKTTAATDMVLGVALEESTEAGQSVPVQVMGIARALVGGVVAYGDPLKLTTAGKLIVGIIGTDPIVAQALQASTADGERISVNLSYRAIS